MTNNLSSIARNVEAIEEIRKYIELLSKMQNNGFKCTKEISEALEVLHKAMGLGDKNVIAKFKKSFKENDGKIILVGEKDRGVGKSFILAEYSKKYNIPVVTGLKMHEEIMVENYGALIFRDGVDKSNGVLIDCATTLDEILKLKSLNIKIRGGFHHSSFLTI